MMNVSWATSKTILISLLFFPLVCVVACTGRPQTQSRNLSIAAFGVKPGLPTVVAFSALWCHPCREEIETLNRASEEFAGQIQIVGYLVEGEQKGSSVVSEDLARFTSFAGNSPVYPVRTDAQWTLFDAAHAPQGRALPTLVLINRHGETQEIVQQSLDYETQLRPLLLGLLQDQRPPTGAETEPTPEPVNSGEQKLSDSVENWLLRREVATNEALKLALTTSWKAGLKRYSFTEEEMPLAAGKIEFGWRDPDVNHPIAASWYAETATSLCRLELKLNPDATLASVSGSCRSK